VRSSVVLFRARGCLALQSEMLQLFQRQAAVFDPEEITIIAAAFDDAWERLEKRLRLGVRQSQREGTAATREAHY
jgi:hypothetical protein